MIYLERLKRYLASLPPSERDSAIAGLPHAAAFLADALGTWRRSHKATGKPELPELDMRHVVSLDALLAAFGPSVDELLGIDDGAVDVLDAAVAGAGSADGCQACEEQAKTHAQEGLGERLGAAGEYRFTPAPGDVVVRGNVAIARNVPGSRGTTKWLPLVELDNDKIPPIAGDVLVRDRTDVARAVADEETGRRGFSWEPIEPEAPSSERRPVH